EGVQYCRSCYDHLAGYVGVQLTEALVRQGLITETPDAFAVSLEGWQWAAGLGILESEVRHTRRPLARKCLDWSERKPHLAGQFGAAVLGQMINKRWVQRVEFSRELLLTGEGQRQLREQLGITL
ncbi:MAG: transcriptional regulator, partial [Bacteroidota bacterium]